ncbi:MAG: histidine phosphatase family protein [Candidatus Latescibacteria bacterium]|nr:histidine phosphatase family protein [Candidatus Latescibacterota bacterium]
MMISIELLRHGHPEWGPGRIAVDDPELSELGKAQAERAAVSLARKPFDQVFVSPLTRALQTVRPLTARLGIQPQVLPWLAELGHPAFAVSRRYCPGWPNWDIPRLPARAWTRWMPFSGRRRCARRMPGGTGCREENPSEILQRGCRPGWSNC